MNENHRHILLAVASLVPQPERITSFPDLAGRPYDGIQTNEAAIVYLNRLLNGGLDRIFLIVSDEVMERTVAGPGSPTHYEFLCKRLAQEDATLPERIETIRVKNDAQIDGTLRGITRAADHVLAYQQQDAGSSLILSADMTGGYRYSSMMMLSVIQLLRYSGIELGHVYYTDFYRPGINDATSLERTFEMINGANEFVSFGSVQALMDYFEHTECEPSSELSDLLIAMQEFSDTIKICQTNRIESDLAVLKEKIDAFEQSHSDNLQERLFTSILTTIKREYAALLAPERDKLDIIEWCIEKGFLQQALTLCTEWIPIFLVDDMRIIVPASRRVKEAALLSPKKALGSSWEKQFVTGRVHAPGLGPLPLTAAFSAYPAYKDVAPVDPADPIVQRTQGRWTPVYGGIRRGLNHGHMKASRPGPSIIRCLHRYFILTVLRNQTNHANIQDSTKKSLPVAASDIIYWMRDTLKQLRILKTMKLAKHRT